MEMKTGPGPKGNRRLSLREKFEDRWIPEPNSGCWLWLGAMNNCGYGHITHGKGNKLLAHRVSWELAHGPIPNGIEVRHFVCDNRACVNPGHMRLGTHADNMADMYRRFQREPHAKRVTKLALTALSFASGLKKQTIRKRVLELGWSLERALNEPIRCVGSGPKKKTG